MKVVLINLHGDTNMTAAYLHSLIEKAGFSITTIHFRRLLFEIKLPSKGELKTLKSAIDKIDPEIVLMSVNSMSFWTAVEITRMLEDRKIIWGGVEPLIEPERCLNYVNIIVRGEGDEAIISLLENIKNKKPLGKINNVWIKKGKRIIRNDFGPLVEDLDSLPLPSYDDRNKIYILGERLFTRNPLPHSKYEYNITFSRGCPFSCKYCLNHFLNKTFRNRYLRRKSVRRAIEELVFAKNHFPKLRNINFWDDVFMMDSGWVRDFAKEYKEKINLPFFAYGNANFVNEENMRMLKKAGISFFDLGVQSGSTKIRNEIFGRSDTNSQILEADRIIHKFRIPVGYDVIFSEFETEETMIEGLKFFLRFRKPFKIQRNKLAYYPNFEITKRALEKNLIKEEQIAGVSKDVNSQIMQKREAEKFPIMNYYYFLGKRWIPNKLVIFMLEKKWHKKYPSFLVYFGDLINKLENFQYSFQSMFKMIISGDFEYVYNRIFNKKSYMN